MIVRIQVIKVYDVDTESGDTTDPESVRANLNAVETMQSTEIERTGKLRDCMTDHAEVVGPSDEE